jgi:hypothetical protein
VRRGKDPVMVAELAGHQMLETTSHRSDSRSKSTPSSERRKPTTSSAVMLLTPAIAGASFRRTVKKSDDHRCRGGRNHVSVDATPSHRLVHQPY